MHSNKFSCCDPGLASSWLTIHGLIAQQFSWFFCTSLCSTMILKVHLNIFLLCFHPESYCMKFSSNFNHSSILVKVIHNMPLSSFPMFPTSMQLSSLTLQFFIPSYTLKCCIFLLHCTHPTILVHWPSFALVLLLPQEDLPYNYIYSLSVLALMSTHPKFLFLTMNW